MPKIEYVYVAKDGNLIAVKTLSQRICKLLEHELTYTKIRSIRGKEAYIRKKRIEFIKTACYQYKPAQQGRKLVTNYGYYDRINEKLTKAGYTVILKDLRPLKDLTIFTPQWGRIKGVKWRPRQEEIVNLLLTKNHGRISCPTGWGKTFCIVQLARLLPRARILVTTKSKKIIRDIYRDLCVNLPDVGIISSGKQNPGHRIMVVSAGSLHHIDPDDFDIVLADECHELAAPSYLMKLAKFRNCRMFAFSASQDMRPDNQDFELEGVFGPLIANITYQEAQAAKMVVPIHVIWDSVPSRKPGCSPCDGMSDTAKSRHCIWRNAIRNKVIAGCAHRYDDATQVLIVVDKIEHGMYLKKLLPEFALVYAEDALEMSDRDWYIANGFIPEDEPFMTPKHRARLDADYESGALKKAIATSVWNRGVNFHKLQVLIRADGGGSPIPDTQVPGRVCRISQDKALGVLHDFLDEFDSSYQDRARRRRRNYESFGWTQELPGKEAKEGSVQHSALHG